MISRSAIRMAARDYPRNPYGEPSGLVVDDVSRGGAQICVTL